MDETIITTQLHKKRQDRLKALVDKFDVEIVAAAAGLSIATVEQYCRVQNPPTIGETRVFIAESVLEGL